MTQPLIVVISGPVCGGKSLLAHALANRFGGVRLSTREILLAEVRNGEAATRATLQRIGTELDESTEGRWVADRLSTAIYNAPERLVVVDAARTASQIAGLRRAFGRQVRHVHVTASAGTRAERYEKRLATSEVTETGTYADVMSDSTEASVGTLAPEADIAVHTDRAGPGDVVVRVAAQLGLLDRSHAACVDVVIGGGYGSEGKGNIAFYLAPEYDILMRVGGPNAGHKVYLASGEKFTHHSLPSGTQAGQADLVLGPGSVVYPPGLLDEIARCDVNSDRLSIDPHVMIIEDEDKQIEAGLVEAIGSTASGTGVATSRRLLRGDAVRLARHVPELYPYVRPTHEILERAYSSGKRVMLEGTQGSGLSLHHGHYPFVTSRDTNVAGCLAEAGIAPARVRRVVLVTRTYPIRVWGNSGPLTAELDWDEIERRSGLVDLAEKERTSTTNRLRRVGEPEWDLLRRSALHNAPTDVALTFADYLSAKNLEASRYEQLTEDDTAICRGGRACDRGAGLAHLHGIHAQPRDHRQAPLVKPVLTPEYMANRWPRLFHTAEQGSWDSIQRYGLRSTTALLDLFEVDEVEREPIESARRPESIKIDHPLYGVAWLRDNKPTNATVLRRTLVGMSEAEWYRTLNRRVFFWLEEARLDRLRNAPPYRDRKHDVLVLSTARLLAIYADTVELCHLNSGAVHPAANYPRGAGTFARIPEYPWADRLATAPKEPIVELTLPYMLKDAQSFVIDVSTY